MLTFAIAQIAEHFEPNTVLWTFHTIQPYSLEVNGTLQYTIVRTMQCHVNHRTRPPSPLRSSLFASLCRADTFSTFVF